MTIPSPSFPDPDFGQPQIWGATDQVRELLLQHKGKQRSLSTALSLLAASIDGLLTWGGALLMEEGYLSNADLDSLIWVTPELDPKDKQIDKSQRMYPIAIRLIDQSRVRELHEMMLSDPEGWQKFVDSNSMLPLSLVMSIAREKLQPKPRYYLVGFGPASAEALGSMRKWPDYVGGRLALIGSNDTGPAGQYMLFHRSLPHGVPIAEYCEGKGEFEPFVDWLRRFRTDYIYGGYEFQGERTSFWAAFTPRVQENVVRAVETFGRMLHSDLLDSFRAAVLRPDSLQTFWAATSTIGHDEIHAGSGRWELREFLGLSPSDPWPEGWTDEEITRVLRGMCSQLSSFEGGPERLTMRGAYLMLLGAIASQHGSWKVTGATFEVHLPEGTDRLFFPFQPHPLPRDTGLKFFEMLRELVVDDDKHDLLRRVIVNEESMSLDLQIDALSPSKEGRSELAKALSVYLTEIASSSYDASALGTRGRSAEAIIQYWLHSHLRFGSLMRREPVFPRHGTMEIRDIVLDDENSDGSPKLGIRVVLR